VLQAYETVLNPAV